ncbi:MAG: ThiF family adenylyltransferase [Salibacteraceae bacterium]|nr:ThiF family adenylyltransferase [Salibacteraceae bacterium]
MESPIWKSILISYKDFLSHNVQSNTFDLKAYEVIDSYEHQVKELFEILNIGKHNSEKERDDFVRTFVQSQLGEIVLYPWVKKAARILSEEFFIKVRTNRNQNKITADEQDLLATKRVGIIGMSVGRCVATTMALERISGELRLADFDTLDLSNLNRLKAPIYDLGLPKVVSVAREIATFDPFLNLTLYPEGATNDNLDAFLNVGGKLNVLVDECDSLEVKIRCRIWAKKYRIPVVMETSDRGMLDIERFDLEPDRPIFHGMIEDFDWELALKDPNEKMKLLKRIVNFELLSERAKSSMAEIGKTLKTWPQLASAVMHGGGAVTEATRKILLDQNIPSGRYYLDFDEFIR